MQWNEPDTLVNGLYPLGYPLLLHLAIEQGIDALHFGFFLSWSGGLLALIALFLLIYNMTDSLVFAISGTTILLINVNFILHATYEGNDMLAMGLQATALVTLWHSTTDKHYSKLFLALFGILLGLAYLSRYTALILLPIAFFYLFIKYIRSPKVMFSTVALILIPFLVITAIQWVPSLVIHDNLFYNQQAKNVWFGIYGEQDWVNNWGKVPDTISLTEVIAMDPIRFFSHWWHQLQSAFISLRMWPLFFHIASILALPVLIFSQQLSSSRRLLLLMVALVPLSVTALAWLSPRFLLLTLWIQALLITWLAFCIKNTLPLTKRIRSPLIGVILLLLTIVLQWEPTNQWFNIPPVTRPQEVNNFLRLAGMQDAQRASTNDPYLHATDEPARTRYTQSYFVMPNPNTAEEFLTHPSVNDWQYLVMDYQHGFGEYAPLRDEFVGAKSYLAPLMLTEQRDIFCVVPCSFKEAKPINLIFDNGIQLSSYQVGQIEEQIVLYLYWKTEVELEQSYKISVRFQNSSGEDITQIDNIPQLWTFPTNAWPVQKLVVDFYLLDEQEACQDCMISLVVYDENTLEPLLAKTEDGQTVGPLLHVHHFSNTE